MKKKIGIVSPWLGLRNAEFEVKKRIKSAAHQIGAEVIILDNYGRILDEDHNLTNRIIDSNKLDLVLSLHYESPKFLDTFYYGVLWNPPGYVIEYNKKFKAIENCNMYDAFLSYSSEKMHRFSKSTFYQFDKKEIKNFDFVASPPDAKFTPNLENPYIFYCGINFERPRTGGRHSHIFKKLEEKNILRIYGPKKFGSIEPWKGYKSYAGEIPFDGISLIKEINKCGIALILASDIHRRYDVITSRIYEAASAGAVVITNKSNFILKEFGNSVLTIDYPIGNQENVHKQIIKHFIWIKNNKEKALKKAIELQRIFTNKFCMKVQLKKLLKDNKKNQLSVQRSIFARKKSSFVDVVIIWDRLGSKGLEDLLVSLNNQKFKSFKVTVFLDKKLTKIIKKIFNKKLNKKIPIKINELEIFSNHQKNKIKLIGRGNIVSEAAASLKANYCSFLFPESILFSDHYTTLVRCLEDNSSKDVAYSGVFTKEKNNTYKTLNFDNLNVGKFSKFNFRFLLSSLLIRKDYIKEFSDGLLDPLDQSITYPIILSSLKDDRLMFSHKMTSGSSQHNDNLPKFHFSAQVQIDYIKSLYGNNFDFPELQPKPREPKLRNINLSLLKRFQMKKINLHYIFLRLNELRYKAIPFPLKRNKKKSPK